MCARRSCSRFALALAIISALGRSSSLLLLLLLLRMAAGAAGVAAGGAAARGAAPPGAGSDGGGSGMVSCAGSRAKLSGAAAAGALPAAETFCARKEPDTLRTAGPAENRLA